MKRLLLTLILGMFLISCVSAFEFDNSLRYEDNDMKVTLENAFGLPFFGSDLGSVELKSHSYIDEVRPAKVGKDVTMWYEFDKWIEYKDGLGIMEFRDIRSGNLVNREYRFVYLTTESYEENIYQEKLKTSLNGTRYYEREIIGTETKQREVWKPYNSKDIPKKNIIIGIEVEVLPNDLIDGVWTIAGKKITRHAPWTGSFNILSPTDMTSNILPSPYAVYPSSEQGGYLGFKAFDGDESSEVNWRAGSLPAWIVLDVGDANKFIATNITLRDSFEGGSGSIKDGTLYGSTDNSTWIELVTFNGQSASLGNYTYNFSSNEVVYRYYNFTVDDDAGAGTPWISGIYIWGHLPSVPVVTIDFPLNITYNETLTQLNYTLENVTGRCWSSIDGGLTNSSDVAGGINFTLFSVPDSNNWTVFCNNSDGNLGQDTVFFISNVSVRTNIIAPLNTSKFNITDINFTIDSIPINTDLTNVSIYVWYSNGTLAFSNTTTLSGSSEIQTNFSYNLGDSVYYWWAETNGINVTTNRTANNTFEIHTTPSSVIIHDPKGTIGFIEIGSNLTLNWTIQESGQNLTAHIKNCSYTYNGVTTYLPNVSVCIEINQTSFLYVNGVNNLTFTVIEEFGLITTNTTSWDFLFEKYNVTFENQSYEGTQETFSAEIILGGNKTITQAIFYYNDTNYTTNILFSGGEYLVTSSILIPSVNITTNFSLGFYIVVEGQTYDLQTFNQTVLNINLTTCGVGDQLLLNLSLHDEMTKELIVGDIEINAQAISKTSNETVSSVNLNFTNVSFGAICLSPIEAFENFYLGTEIRYVSEDYAPEFYYIQQADMINYPKNLSLFDLSLNESTEFLVTYQDDDLIKVEGAIVQLQRKYISEDLYEVVEAPLTSDIGTAVIHVDLNTNKYKATVVKDGIILDIFENLVFHCENELSGQCTELLLGKIDSQNDVPLVNLKDFSYAISSTNNTITTLFSIPSGTPSEVNILLMQVDQFGNESQCNQTIISSGGSIDCTFDDTIGDSFLQLQISKDQKLEAQENYIVTEDSGLDFLGNNFFIVIIMMLSVVGMAFSSPEWMIINAVVVMLIGGSLWLLNGLDFVMGLGSLMWLIVASGILIYKLSKQEDR